jgi:hypothetical protein
MNGLDVCDGRSVAGCYGALIAYTG